MSPPNLKAMFDSLPTTSRLRTFDNERYFGIVVSFAEQGFGFGEISFSVTKETGAAYFDNEDMRMQHCAEILMRCIGSQVEAVEERDAS